MLILSLMNIISNLLFKIFFIWKKKKKIMDLIMNYSHLYKFCSYSIIMLSLFSVYTFLLKIKQK